MRKWKARKKEAEGKTWMVCVFRPRALVAGPPEGEGGLELVLEEAPEVAPEGEEEEALDGQEYGLGIEEGFHL